MKHSPHAGLSRVLFAVIFLLAFQILANAVTETVLHQFVNLAQGATPAGDLVADAQGNVYGTTYNGGSYGFGTVYRLSRNSSGKWAQTVIHNFTGLTDGFQPNSLAIDAAGNLFGATSGGGSSSFTTQGYGIVFELSRAANGSWTLTVVHAFAGQFADGYTPAGVALDSAGNVYGVAYGGVSNSNACSGQCGLVFRVVHSSSGWTEHSIYEFKGKQDGALPVPSLTFDSAGNLYGATQDSSLPWTIFQLTPSSTNWTLTTLFTTTNVSTQGGAPNGVTFDASGNIFATSMLGGPTNNGVVFELVHGSTGWTQTVLHTFTGGTDGSGPAGNPRFDSAGNLVGTTYWGGTAAACASNLPVGGCGIVYQFTPSGGSWTETILHVFSAGSDGVYPIGPLVIEPNGNLVGATVQGSLANVGTVFDLAPSSGGYTEAQVYGFPATDGNDIRGGLVADSAGNLYGVAPGGSLNQCPNGGYIGCGSIFKLTHLANGTWQRTVIHNFTGSLNGDGAFPYASLTFDSAGNLYGTTSNGLVGGGTVFKLSPTASGGWSFRTIYTFGSHHLDGYNPWGTLVLDAAGNIYGTTIAGGNGSYLNCNYCGTVFKLAPTASGRYTESVIYNFQGGNDGSFPTAGVTLDSAGNLYGTTSEGGFFSSDLGFGVVFKLSPNSNGTWTQSVLYTFTGTTDGSGPRGSVILDAAGNLYGTTATAGAGGNCNYGCGVAFKLTPTASGPWTETVLYNFLGNGDGASPLSNLTFDAAGDLYGTTSGGGTAFSVFCGGGCGTVFKLTPSAGTWNETVLYSFQGPTTDGATPYAGIIFDADGNIYGTTSVGGINGESYLNGGTVFRLTP